MTVVRSFVKRITHPQKLRKNLYAIRRTLSVICCGTEMMKTRHDLEGDEVNWFMTCPTCKRTLFVQQLEAPNAKSAILAQQQRQASDL